jgi:lambda family phage minor tail protein L
VSIPVSELQKIVPSSVIELFVLELNTTQHGVSDTYRFHAGANMDSNGELVWAGNTYQRFPIEAEGFEYSGNGQLPRPKVRVSNILGTITAILLTLPSGLEGAKFTRIRTLARYIDAVNFPGGVNPYGTPDPTAAFPSEVYFIDRKTSENRDVVEFELAAAFDLAGVRAPKRQCIANICQWVYRSAECGYTGSSYWDANDNVATTLAADVCGKRLSSCKLRFGDTAQLPFGSFPGIGTYFT